jgi:hypothetical protein
MGRTYGSHDFFMLLFNGLKSFVAIFAEAVSKEVLDFQ